MSVSTRNSPFCFSGRAADAVGVEEGTDRLVEILAVGGDAEEAVSRDAPSRRGSGWRADAASLCPTIIASGKLFTENEKASADGKAFRGL